MLQRIVTDHAGVDDARLTAALGRRRFLSLALGAPALAAIVASCGNSASVTPATQPGSTAANTSTSTTLAPSGIIHPTGPDEVVLKIAYEGGLLTPNGYFTRVPQLLITGTGRVIAPDATPAVYPGPLLPALLERRITEAGIEKVLAFAEAAHLLQTPPDYSADTMVADVPDTVVTLAANGAVYVHGAAALGFTEPEHSAVRRTLDAFVRAMTDIDTIAGAAELNVSKPFVATHYRIKATRVGADPANNAAIATTVSSVSSVSSVSPSVPPTVGVVEPAPRYVAWPATAGIRLADASNCTLVSAVGVGKLFETADQLTYFTEDSEAYQVAAVAELPGEAC